MINITKYISTANKYLKENRPGTPKITANCIADRFKTANLLSIEADSKTVKGTKQGYLTGILYLAPYKTVGFNMCPFAKTCVKDCLFNSGRGRFGSVTRARIIKTLMFLSDPAEFKTLLARDIIRLKNQANKQGLIPVVRINGTSDLLVERVFRDLLVNNPDVRFYDYTKNPNRFSNKLPSNYDLTFSFDGTNLTEAKNILDAKLGRVSVVFKDKLPSSWFGYPVIDGDTSDLRFLDDKGVVVGLVLKKTSNKDINDTFIQTIGA